MEVETLLKKFTENSYSHACWLNSLSYLEYRGFRKIARSQTTEDITADILGHALEEVRHALYFKKLAIRVGGGKFNHYSTSTLIAESALKNYFYHLDFEVDKKMQSMENSKLKKSVYEFVTWLIEERAMSIYHTYNQILKANGFDFSLAPVIADEAKHLDEFRQISIDRLNAFNLDPQSLIALEDSLFIKLWKSLEESVSMPTHDAITSQ